MVTKAGVWDVPDDWAAGFFDDGFEHTFQSQGKYESTSTDIQALLKLLSLRPGARILDVPCGFGRHAGPLHKRGFAVTGIDSSPAQINQARKRWPKVTFELRDMREPPPGPFDAVLNLWTSFGYLETVQEDARALASWRRVLRPGGSLVMELTTLERAEHENRSGREPVSTKRLEHSQVTEEAWYDWTAQLAHVRYSRPGWSRECRTRMYSRPQLRAALCTAGFTGIRMMGGFSGSPVNSVDRTIIVATTPSKGQHT